MSDAPRRRSQWAPRGAGARGWGGAACTHVLPDNNSPPPVIGCSSGRALGRPRAPCPSALGRASSTSPPAIGAARVGWARRGGAGLPRRAPGRSRRAQRARHALPEAGRACPATRFTAGPAQPHRLRSAATASRRLGGAGRYGPVAPGHRAWRRPSAKGAHELPRLHMCLELRRHPRHGGTGLLVPMSSRRDAQRPWSALLIATGPLRRPLPLGRHAAARSRSARGATARCRYLCEGK